MCGLTRRMQGRYRLRRDIFLVGGGGNGSCRQAEQETCPSASQIEGHGTA